MSLKRDDSVQQENSKPSVFPKLEIARKKTKMFSEYRKREAKINSDCYFLVIFWLFNGGRVKVQKMTHNYQFQSVTLYISRTVDHILKIVGTQV